MTRLRAADGLELRIEEDSTARVAWGEPDWLGPLHMLRRAKTTEREPDLAPLRAGEATDGEDDIGRHRSMDLASVDGVVASARAYVDLPLLVFRLAADATPRAGIANGSFALPSFAWPAFRPAERGADGAPAGLTTYGHQYCEFALPVFGDANAAGFVVHPERPRVVEPLAFIAADGRTLLVAPLDWFHEQIIAVGDGEQPQVECGWHGDLDAVPAGFATDIAVWGASSPRRALEEWCGLLRRRHGTARPSRYADPGIARLSYWTDNGATYYYRSHPRLDSLQTLRQVVDDLRTRDIPVASLQIDSWFYPHRNPRAVSDEGAPVVPPSGMMLWEPRSDVFPEGFADLEDAVRGLPLTFHSRHVSADSPYVDEFDMWVDGPYAHPTEERFFAMLMDQARAWGAITYEQDWLVESFLGVRGLRAHPGRARAWQEALDRAARERGLTLQWCMGTPADFLQTVTLSQVTSIRTSGDYRYLFDNGLNWVWFLHGNALARALGLHPYKDVLLTHGPTDLSPGEEYAEIEMLLAALSAGPVGIGDEIGRSNRDLVLRACREDGVLVKPDVPIAALDRCFRRNGYTEVAPLIGETRSTHPAGTWHYVATFNASAAKVEQEIEVALADLGADDLGDRVVIVDWRRRSFAEVPSSAGWTCRLGFQEWDYRIVCPLLAGGEVAVFGDLDRYVTVGDQHIGDLRVVAGSILFAVRDRPGALVRINGWSRREPRGGVARVAGQQRALGAADGEFLRWQEDDGRWELGVRVDANGHTTVELVLA